MLEHIPDHDLLIRLDQKVDGLIEKVDGMTNDHEKRIRSLERWRWMLVGAYVLITTALGLFVIYFPHK